MKIIALLILVTLCGCTYAQQQTNSRNAVQMTELEKATSKKKFGRGLTVAGGVLFSIGLIVGSNSSETTTTTNRGAIQTSSTGNPGLAKACFVTGIAGLSFGIPMWSVNASREKKLKHLQGVTITFIPQVNGLTLRCAF